MICLLCLVLVLSFSYPFFLRFCVIFLSKFDLEISFLFFFLLNVGGQLRAFNEVKHETEIKELLLEWDEILNKCSRIFIGEKERC